MQAIWQSSERILRSRPSSTGAEASMPVCNALDQGAAAAKLLLDPFETAIKMIDPVDHRLTLRRERRDHERHRSAQIGCHHRRPLQRLHPFDHGRITLKPDPCAEAGELLDMHEAVLENRLD